MAKIRIESALVIAGALLSAPSLTHAAPAHSDAAQIARGRYMVLTGHCNNCHTPTFIEKKGQMPDREWLTGNPIGFRTPVGTVYASNLRLTVPAFSENEWVKYAKTFTPRPPMPWWTMHETTEDDLRAMYRFIRSLGPAGSPAPAFVPPDKEPPRPYEVRQLMK